MKYSISVILGIILFMTAFRCSLHDGPGETGPGDTTLVIRTVECLADTTQTYCIALPPGPDSGRYHPVVFVFDPHGEGHLAVNVFREGALKFGFIVVGSNVIRNGYERTDYALQVLADDVMHRYPVDGNRIYAAGFSGGGRVAQHFSQQHTAVKAVASMGAGYSIEQAGLLRNKASMLFIAGTEDFNYHEVRNSIQFLTPAGIHYYIMEYPGTHAWPGSNIIDDVLHWFEFDDYRRYPPHTEKRVVKDYMTKIRDQATALQAEDDIAGAAGACSRGMAFLSGITSTGSLERKFNALRQSAQYKHLEKQANDALELEIRLQQGYLLALRERDTLWWKNEVGMLDEKIGRNEKGPVQAVYIRIRSFLSIAAYGHCNGSLRQGDLRMAEQYISVYRIVDPRNPDMWYFHALYLARSGKNEEAAAAYRKAISLGFTDLKKARQELPAKVFAAGDKP